MKTIFSLSLLCLLSSASVQAQTSAHYDNAASKTPGHWEASTNYQVNGTEIRFYDGNKQLIHQEVYPNKLVKLTKKNVERLDITLAKVMDKQLVPSEVKTVTMPASTEDPRVVNKRRRIMEAERRASSADLTAQVVGSTSGNNAVLKVFIYNPHEERLRIEIQNAQGNPVCKEYTTDFQHYYRFNLNSLQDGNYRVQIYKIPQRKPSVDNLISLSRQPQQTTFTVKTALPSGTSSDALVSGKN